MTLFEYIAVAASLICSFVAVHLLGGIPATLDRERRYWVHALWVLIAIYSITLNWWIFWSYRQVDWDFIRFLVALVPLGLLYVAATLLIPAEASQVRSWRDHFSQVRVRFFAVNIAYLAAVVLATVLLLGHPLLHPRRILPAMVAAMFTAGLAFDNQRVQAAIVVGFAVLNVVGALVFLRPEAFGVAG